MNKKPRGYWTKERCREVALTCNSRPEFKKKYNVAYRYSYKNGWLDEICSHMESITEKPRGYWTKERCHEVALMCNFRYELQKKFGGAYNSAHKNGWLDEICSHMERDKHWTKERCHEVALTCNSRYEFQKKFGGAYASALKNGWLDEICSHMENLKKPSKRYLYVYEFNDNHVYVGLTSNPKRRNLNHLSNNKRNKSKVRQHSLICNNYKFIIITETPIDEKEASKLEISLALNYKESGWILLNNISSLGSLGSNKLYWTKERCHEVALKCKSKSEFNKKYAGAYFSAHKNGWLDEICSHMEFIIQKPNGYWTKERCYELALKCKSKSEFKKKYPGGYSWVFRNGLLDEIFSHMEDLKKPRGYWTKERCHEIALTCNSRIEFQKKYKGAYLSALKNGWLDEICSHMEFIIRPSGYWTKERCHEVALTCSTRNEFRKKFGSVYESARKNGCLDEICSHMKKK